MTSEFDSRQHWDEVYRNRPAHELTWFQARPTFSLALIERCEPRLDAAIIDIGGGASLLTKYLLESGYTNLSLLDISPRALAIARAQLQTAAERVQWIEQDVTRFQPPEQSTAQYWLWHDRAVFHFLTRPQDRTAYRNVLGQALAPGGFAIIAAFPPHGPNRCSGLDTMQYDADSLSAQLGPEFQLLEQRDELHATPSGGNQAFRYFLYQRTL
jgi:trans-aconitate methyltransferase